jgi:hypothetical protein
MMVREGNGVYGERLHALNGFDNVIGNDHTASGEKALKDHSYVK